MTVIVEGEDQGADSVEHLLSALAGCLTTTFSYYTAIRDTQIEEPESDFKNSFNGHTVQTDLSIKTLKQAHCFLLKKTIAKFI